MKVSVSLLYLKALLSHRERFLHTLYEIYESERYARVNEDTQLLPWVQRPPPAPLFCLRGAPNQKKDKSHTHVIIESLPHL